MEFFVAEWQKFLLVNHLYAAARSEEIWLFSQAIQSKTPVKCLGMPGGRWAVLELTGSLKINKSPLSDTVRLPFQGGKLLSLTLF